MEFAPNYKAALLIVAAAVTAGVGGFHVARPDSADTPPVQGEATHESIIQNAQAFILPSLPTTYLPIRNFNIPEPAMNARAALLVDGASGRTLFSLNPDQKLPIASITKLMTAIVVLEHFDLQEVYTVSAEDINVDGLGGDFAEGDQLRGSELLKMTLIKSSNDAANVFAAHAHREGIDFVGLMNQEAQALGMSSTHFSDPAGLNDRETYSTANDVATLTRAALQYPQIREITKMPRGDIPTRSGTTYHVTSTNQLLSVLPKIMLGKTGNTPAALGTMTLVVGVDGDDYLISVVLGTADRFGETRKLIEWGNQAHQWN